MEIPLPSDFPSNNVENAKAWLMNPANSTFPTAYEQSINVDNGKEWNTLQALILTVTTLMKKEFLKYWRTASAPVLGDPSWSRIKHRNHDIYNHGAKVANQVAINVLSDTEVAWKENLEDWLKAACKAFSRRGVFCAKKTSRDIKQKAKKGNTAIGEDYGNDQTSEVQAASKKFKIAQLEFMAAQREFVAAQREFKTAQLEFRAANKIVPIEIDPIVIQDDEPPAKRPRTEDVEDDDKLETKEAQERKLMGEIIKMRIAKMKKEREAAKIKAAEGQKER
jgi:hypothetical protein